ncbi:metalloregulator ArsR/SmtB family transcription factor [Sphingomonas lacunae]|uniref:Metalloregulator ArsR/SmtB family transcription factor n=1 Tax=Sphingomonas lacunae TaxID=2698828 RepID=A0A6M4AYP2_9SPHN|nr:metalloregulator ArsR/SmtB family transcription factor [Sphingomonas lacunae]QJQ33492.1 metalloregulator ArsR/SmtB family transcription factor [Sphingomonas lacunae]
MHSVLGLFAALSDASRLRIIALLRHYELAVGEIAQLLDQSQPRVSRHVRILEEAGLVERCREGSWVFVRLARNPQVAALLSFAGQLPLAPAERRIAEQDRNRLAAVQAEREAAAARYFAAHANEWDAIRSLHVAEEEVERAILTLMRNRRLGHMVDVGTGTGRMAGILGPAASKVTAIDRSPEMLRIARTNLAAQSLPVELVQGDFMALPLADASVDSIIMHQVLHYASMPDLAIAEAARVLRGSGHLLIADFAPHDREELRRDAAHVRLGFSDGQIRGWFAASGLILETTEALSGGELTVKLWLGRRRSDQVRDPLDKQNRKVAA